ncbi:hypothetical protein [uncultured Psychrobacter sp.]|uniref:hypothetical protein n=1 Tax=uncultured Psychrobacter sp. TaxID=259303 RepID=UPI0034574E94
MVLFLISNYEGFNTGHGGHYYSLRQMAESIAKYEKVVTIVLGTEMPIVLADMKDAHHVPTKLHLQKKALKDAINKLKALELLSRLSVVHAYDAKSVYVGSYIAKIIKIPFILTKCGGKAPKKFYPKVSSLIVFHKTDYDHFDNYKKGYNNLYLIPNRVKPTRFCEQRKNQIDSISDKNVFNIIKIGRIGTYYHKTLTSAIKFCAEVQSPAYPIKLTFIGYQESADIANELHLLSKKLNVNLSIHSESSYTSNASELIWACDASIGTGRGAMEALSAGKILLFPVANFDYPCLFNEQTAPFAIRDNFSERVKLPEELSNYCNPKHLMSLLSNNNYKDDLRKFGTNFFNLYFNVDVGAEKIIDIYNNSQDIAPISRWYLLYLRFYNAKLYFKYRSKPFRHQFMKALRL